MMHKQHGPIWFVLLKSFIPIIDAPSQTRYN